MNIFQLSLFWLLCFASSLSVLLGEDPCTLDDYKDLNQGDRSEAYKDATDKCDGNDLKDEWHYWHLVSGNAGNALATINAPGEGRCGTTDRLYLKDHHPFLGEGEVTLRLCIAKGNKNCQQEQSIQVINCGAFYLYKLYNHGGCSTPWRYCTNGEETVSCEKVNCPSGQTCTLRKNGEERHCQDPSQVQETTNVLPVTETSTSTAKSATNATTASPTSETTTAQPTTDTTAKPTSDTTTTQPATNATTVSPTSETIAQPTTDTTTAKPTSDTNTAQAATNATTASPTSETTTAQLTRDTTTAKPTSDKTTAQPATNATTASPTSETTKARPKTDTTTAKATSNTTTAQPATNATTASPTSEITAQPTTDTTTAKPTSDTSTANTTTTTTTTNTTTKKPATNTTTEKPTSDTTTMALKSAEFLPALSSKSSVITTTTKEPDAPTKTLPTAAIKPKSSEATWSKSSTDRKITELAAATLKATATTSKIEKITTSTALVVIAESTATEISTPTTSFQTETVNSKLSKTEPTAQLGPETSLLATTEEGTATELAVIAAISTITLEAPVGVTSPPLLSQIAGSQARKSVEAASSESSSAKGTTEQAAIVAMSTKSNLKPPLSATSPALPSVSKLETRQSVTSTATLLQSTLKPPAVSAASSSLLKITLETVESALASSSETLSALKQKAITPTFAQSVLRLSPFATSPSFPSSVTLKTRGTRQASSKYLATLEQAAISAASTKSSLEPPIIETSPLFLSITTLQTRRSTESTPSEYLATLELTAITAMSTESTLEPPEIAMTPTFSSIKTSETGESKRGEDLIVLSRISTEEGLIKASSLTSITTTLQTPESPVATYFESSTTSDRRTRTRTRTRTGVAIGTTTTTMAFLPQPSATSISKSSIDNPALPSEAVTETDAITATVSKATIGSVDMTTSLPLPLSITAASTAIPLAQATSNISTTTITTTTIGTTKGQEALLMIATNTECKLTPPTRTATSREVTEEMNTALKALFKSEMIKTTTMLTLPYGTGGKTVTPPLHVHGSTSSEVVTTITTPTATTITATTAAGMVTVTSVAGQPADDPCVPNPCENYGNCSRTVEPQGFNCSCTSEYTGAACENKIVHGNWSIWTQWPNCNKPCNGGNKTRKRQCDNPKPAFGGRYCIGPATETQFCNMDICPAAEVNYEVRFKAETWSDELENPESGLYKNYKDEIQDTVMAFYSENGETVTFKLLGLRQGSIIASFNVTYTAIDSLQVVVLQEQIAGGTLGNFAAELLNITSKYVPNEAPVILDSKSSTSTTIELKWSEVTQLNSVPLLGYVIIYKEHNTKFQHDIQKSVLPLPRETVLKDLKKFTNYTIRVYAFTRNGNGIPSEAVTLQTQEDVPSESPPNTVIIVTSSRNIRVSWQPINEAYVHGILLGYEVTYAKDDGSTLSWISKRPGAEKQQILLDELAPYTWYWVVICARTSKGCGKEYFDHVQTWEDVPSMPPMQLTAYNFTSEASIVVSWSPVPSNHINGILLGYSLKYERFQTSERKVLDVDEHALTLRPTDLSVSLQVQAYSIYRIRVAAFTHKGMGPYTEYAYAESCRCSKVLYTNFWSTPPYLKVNMDDKKMGGIFSRIVTDMIFAACGLCPGHGSATIIKITTNGKGEYSAKKSISEVLGDIDDVPQISFPIYGNKDITRYLGAYAYINLVESPGVAFIAAKRLPRSMAKNMINAVLECFPMIMLSACMAYISGFIVWVLDSRFNPDEFPPAFIKGVGEGFWWSFISMTTVGYGDRAPRSIPARIFGIIWILIGLVVISILIGAIASSLTFVTVDKPVTLYGAKIGAIQNSVEYRLGILKNAKVNEEREYNSVDEIRTAIEEGEIDGALLDTYVAAEHKETLFNDRVYVKEILDRPIGYGVVLSGAAVSVEQRCRDYINMHITEIFHIIQNMTRTLDAPADNFAMEESTRLFDSTSEMFRIAMASLLAVLGVALLGGLSYHFLIFVPRIKRINEERATEQQCSYRKALNGEMIAFVDSFYEDMSEKISSIKKELQQEILNKKARPKCAFRVGRSADSSKRDTESSIVGSRSTLSSWTSETQYEKRKQIFQLVPNGGNIQLEQGSQQDLQKPFPSFSGVYSKYEENCRPQRLPNVVISDDDLRNGDSSC